MCNCVCIWPLIHIQKWIPASPFLCFSLTNRHTNSDTQKEKYLEKEKIKTAPIWFIYHLSFSITLQNWAKCSPLYSFPSFSPYPLIHAGLETKWECKKAVPIPTAWFPFSVTPWLLSAQRVIKRCSFVVTWGSTECFVEGVSQEKSGRSATAFTANLSPGGKGKSVLSNSSKAYQREKDRWIYITCSLN